MSEFSDQIIQQIVHDFYDTRIMSNLVRPHYVERMVAAALGDGWRLVSADWAGWDIQGHDGIRLEVKQSAARQTWTGHPSLEGRSTRGVFDIAPRTGYWTDGGAQWLVSSGRPADVYIFAWHPVEDAALADHRESAQWQFFVVPEAELPTAQKTISLSTVRRRWEPFGFHYIPAKVAEAISSLAHRKAYMHAPIEPPADPPGSGAGD